MSVRTKMLGFVDVILRVPPIFIIDEILKISMGLPFATQNDSTVLESNSQITTISGSAGVPTDSMLFNDNSSSSTISSSNFSSNSSSSLEQFLNTSSAELFGDAMSAAANSAAAADDTEFYKIVSLTSLKFLSCLLGKCLECVCKCVHMCVCGWVWMCAAITAKKNACNNVQCTRCTFSLPLSQIEILPPVNHCNVFANVASQTLRPAEQFSHYIIAAVAVLSLCLNQASS